MYQVVEYEERIDLLLSASDIAVTRAGGGVAELAALGVPAVLVPLPIAPRDHQTANARVLVDSGAAVLVPDSELTVDRLEAELRAILDDAGRRDAMAAVERAPRRRRPSRRPRRASRRGPRPWVTWSISHDRGTSTSWGSAARA
jgi:UDP-N-acetylglucosamine:LPS N-acetylglucosamine transferase